MSRLHHSEGEDAANQNGTMPQVAWRGFEAIADEKRHLLELGSTDGAAPLNPDEPGSVFESVQVSLPLEPPVLKYSRDDGSGQTDKNIVGMGELTRDGRKCVVYGMGIANDADFEQQMADNDCETHAFDCTVDPSSPVVAGKKFTFHNWCIGQKGNFGLEHNTYVENNTKSGGNPALEFKTLSTTMKELGHTHIDLLKFDIEGFEWQLFESNFLAGDNPPEQISFELHTQKANPDFVPHGNVEDKDFVQVNRLFKSLLDLGYRVTSKEINNGDPACAEFVVVNVNTDAISLMARGTLN
jgi:hypothetical protein